MNLSAPAKAPLRVQDRAPGPQDPERLQGMAPTIRRRRFCGSLVALALVTSGCATRQPPLHRKAASEVTLQALSQVGQPYRWGGSRPGEGFDCSGLVQYVYREALGIELPRTSRAMSTRGEAVDRDSLAPGDLVFFQTTRQRNSHVGIYIGDGRFVHAPSSGSLVRVEALDKRYWTKRFNGGRRPVL